MKDFSAFGPIAIAASIAAPAASRTLMKFARNVFLIAGVWGLIVLTPLYFTFDLVGRSYPPAITHADFYYGFTGVALVWQVAFLVIASDPARYRPMMVVAVLEK